MGVDSVSDWVDRILDGDASIPEGLTINQALAALEAWGKVWALVPENVRFYTGKVGTEYRAVLRNYSGKMGVLLGVEWEPKTISVGVYEQAYDGGESAVFMERKVSKVPISALLFEEFVSERELKKDDGVVFDKTPEDELLVKGGQ